MLVRRPAVAGSFYPDDPDQLRKVIDGCYVHPLGPGALPPAREKRAGIMACVCPHAGYAYSGPVAAHSFLWLSSLRKPGLVVIVGPNHYGIGGGVSTFSEGLWETPLGRVPIDSTSAKMLVELTGMVDYDPGAQKGEHSIE